MTTSNDRLVLASSTCVVCFGVISLYDRDGDWLHSNGQVMALDANRKATEPHAALPNPERTIPKRMDGALEPLPHHFAPSEVARGDNSHEVTLWFGTNDEAEAFRAGIQERPVIGLTTFVPIKCEAMVHHGPGHQSTSRCERQDPHPIESDHYHYAYCEAEWIGPRGFASHWG